MGSVRLLARDGEPTRLGALGALGRLCEQNPTLVEATAHIVQTAQSQWTSERSATPALTQAVHQLLTRIEAPRVDAPST
ncbi:hypothetical protein ACH4UR_35810 [Streptomyces lydicus]|uniref:hypothetical protein n=1 Tax=Streptomyces lydicus TaxID=47763 RepID=UPI0033D50892